MEIAQGGAGGDGLARPRGAPLEWGLHHYPQRPGTRGLNGFLLFLLAELSYITYHAGLTHFLFAHIIAEVCDASALVTIALGLRSRVAPVVPGALQHR